MGKFSFAQLTVTTGLTPEQYVEFLVGTGVTFSNVSYSCNPNSIGYFTTGSSPTNLGFDNGIILSTGRVNSAIPIGSPSSNFVSTAINCPGDPNLQAIIHPYTITEATKLEFDFVPASDTIRFQYIFASEEYHEWVNSAYNDVFGFFLSGPNPLGGNYINVNIAIIPGTTTPVAINSVNNGDSYFPCSGGPCENCMYFVDNCNQGSIVFDGFTVTLTAWALVVPCQTYHIKLAIGDAGDRLYDSGVFFLANSFSSPLTTYSITYPDSAQFGYFAVEGSCNNPSITFQYPGVVTTDHHINFYLAGTAVNNVDYLFPSNIVIPAGNSSVSVSLEALADGLNEGVENVMIIYQNSVCTYDTIVIPIHDYFPMNVSLNGQYEICNGQNVSISASVSGGYQPYSYIWSNGNNNATQTVAPSSTTSYTITVSDACGATQTAQTNVVVHDNPIINVNASNIVICSGETITLTATSSISNTTWNWNTGETTQQIQVSPNTDTTYTVTGTTSNGCTSTAQISITVNQTPNVTITGPAGVCLNGSATLTVSGDVAGMSWLWSTGQTSASINVNPTATTSYTVTGTTPNGCTGTATYVLNVHPLPSVTVNASATNICAGTQISLSATSSIPGSTWQWNTGGSSSSFNATPSVTTIYRVTATSPQGCTGSAGVTVTVNPKPVLTVSSSNIQICKNDSTNLTVSSSITGTTFLWNTGSNSSNITVAPTNTTTYTVTGTTAAGCTGTAQITVSVFPVPDVQISATDTDICSGESATLNASSSISGVSWQWSTGQSSASITVSPSTTTSYQVTATTTNGCTASSQIQIVVNPLPVLTISASQNSICVGGNVTLNVNSSIPNTTWQWSTGETNSVINVAPSATTTYSVTGTSPNGCTSVATITITVYENPNITISGPAGICLNSSATLTASANVGGMTWVWGTGQTTSSINVSPGTTTTYTVTGTTSTGCTASATHTVTVNPLPVVTINATQNNICAGTQVSLTASSNIAGSTWQWNTGSMANTIHITPSVTTIYEVTATTPQGCTGSASVVITVNPKPVLSLSATQTQICNHDSSNITVVSNIPGTTFQWDNGSTSSIITVSPSITTTYTVTGTSPSGCTETAQITIQVFQTPDVQVTTTDTLICENQSTSLFASSSLSGVSWQWSNGQTSSNINVSPTTTTTYVVTASTANNCTATAQITVQVNPAPDITLIPTATVICYGEAVEITATSDIPGTTWNWNTGATTATIAVTPLVTTTYSVTGTSPLGCTSSAQITITVFDNPVQGITAQPAVICDGQSSILTANSGFSGITWQWSTGQTSNPITVMPVVSTTYSVTGTATNGCTGSAQITVNVESTPVIELIPSLTEICSGDQVSIAANSSLTGTTWQWNNGQTSNPLIVSPSSTTTYTITGTSPGGCTATAQVTIIVHQNPVQNIISSQNNICANDSVVLTANGSVPGTTWNWSTGQNTNPIVVNPIATSTYSVTGTSPFGCTGSAQITVVVQPNPDISIQASPNVVCENATTTLTANSNLPITNWQWNTGQTVNLITVNPTTITVYSVTGTNASGCSGSAEIEITVNPNPNITIQAFPQNIICVGEMSNLSASSDISGTTWQWNTGQTTANITVSPQITTTYSVTGTTPAGCTASAQISITVLQNPVDGITAVPVFICDGDSSVLTAQSSLSGTTWIWSTGSTNNPITVTPVSTTTYSVTGTSPQGCTGSAEIQVVVSPNPLITLTSSVNTPICQGDIANLTANSNISGTSWQWSTGQTVNPVIVSPTVTTTYTVTGTSPQGCTASASIQVEVYPLPIDNISSSTSEICENDSAILTANGTAVSWIWNTGATTQHITVSPSTTTTYSVTGTSPEGCTSSAQFILVVQNNPVSGISATPPTVCIGNSTTLTANSVYAGITWQWSTGQFTDIITVSPSINTTYSVTGTTPIGCTGTAEILIEVFDYPVINLSLTNPEICIGDSTTITAVSNIAGTTWQWSTGQTANPIVVSPAATTIYSVTGTSPAGCTSSAYIFVIVNRNPIDFVWASATSICQQQSATITIFSGTTGTQWQWNTGDTVNPLVVSPNATTTYTVTATTTEGCTGTASVQIVVHPLPSITISGQTSLCIGESASLTASSNIQGTNWIWNNGQTTAAIHVTPNTSTTYTVTGTATGGCSGSASVNVSVYPWPVITASASVTEICEGENVTVFANSNIAGTTWQWNTGQLSSSFTVAPSATTTYIVTGTTPNGCTGTNSVTVIVHPKPQIVINSPVQSICNSQSATLTTNSNIAGTTWQWNTGQTSSSIVVSPSASTTYSVTGTTQQGCTSVATYQITVNPLPQVTVNATPNQICVGGSAALNAQSNISGTTWQWSTGQTVNPVNVSPSATTTYTVTGTTPAGCTDTGQITVNVQPLPVLTITSPTPSICLSQSAILQVASNINGTTYSWSTGQAGNQITVSPTSTTTYTVTGTSPSGCQSVAQFTVTVHPNPVVTVSAASTLLCPGDNTTLTANSNISGCSWNWNTGATTSQIQVSPQTATTYIVTGTSPNGCSGVGQIQINVLPPLNVNINASSQDICIGSSATISATSSVNGTTWLWSNGSTANQINVSPATTTTYSVTGTSPNGCTGVNQITINVHQNPVDNITATAMAICVGENTVLTANGTVSGTSWVWNTGQTTNQITVSPTATTQYSVTGTSSYGCTGTANIQIIVHQQLNVSVTASATSICVGSSADLTANGNISGTSWVWNTGSTMQTITVAPQTQTTYFVTGTSPQGCTGIAQITVNVLPVPVSNISVSASTICEGESALLTATSGSTGTTWLWNTGQTGNPLTVNPLTTTTYTVTATTPEGCTGVAGVTVNVAPLPVISANISQPEICIGNFVQCWATSNIPGTTWLWNNGQASNPMIDFPLVTTTYSVTGTSPAGCASVASVHVTVNPKPVITLTSTQLSTCAGSERIISATSDIPSTTWLWNTGNTTATINVYPMQNTTYTVTGTSPAGCSETANITLNVLPLPSVTLIADDPDVCYGTGTNIYVSTNSSASTYLWNTGNTTSSIYVQPQVASTYNCTVTDVNGCSNMEQITVDVLPNPLISVNPSNPSVCKGSSITLQANSSLPNTNYIWSNAVQNSLNTVSPIVSTIYSVTGTDIHGCSSTTEVFVEVLPVPELYITPPASTICPEDEVILTVSSDIPNTGYVWSNGQTTSAIIVYPTVNTVYNVTGTAPNGCTGISHATINVHNAPVIMATPFNPGICPGESVTLYVSGASTYAWTPQVTYIVSDGSQVTMQPDSTTLYVVQGVDANGCTGEATITVTVHWPPVADFATDPDPKCVGNPVNFYSLSVPQNEISSYLWTFGDPTSGSSNYSTSMNPSHVYMQPGSYTISLEITSIYGCTSETTKPAFITVHPNPIAGFSVTPSIVDVTSPHVNVLSHALGATSYLYDFGDPYAGSANYSTLEHPSHQYSEEGQYVIWQHVTNEWGCVDSAHFEVTVKPQWQIYIPNAFSPNGDGLNDYFLPTGFNYDNEYYSMYIFTRWGEEIFSTTDPNQGWDGRIKGSAVIAKPDVYVYMINVRNVFGHDKQYVGNVTIVK